MPIPSTQPPWRLAGDADLVLLTALDLRPPLSEDRPVLSAPQEWTRMRRWVPTSPTEVVEDLRGSLTYGDAEQKQVLTVLELGAASLAGLQAALAAALPTEVDPSTFAFKTCEALVLTSGSVSFRLHLAVVNGWSTGDVLVAFGPEHRDHVCRELREALLPLLSEVQEAVMGSVQPLDLAYFHLMYGGSAQEHAGAGQDQVLRTLIYPPSAAPLPSQSPRREEFVFLGYAFSLVVVPAGAARRMRELSRLVGLCSVVYRRLERVCDAIDATLHEEDGTCDRQSLLRLEERVQVEYQALLAPTLTYRHELLVMREALLREWQADRLATRSRTLLALLAARVTRLDQEQGTRTARKLELLLFAVAAMSVFSVATDARNLVQARDWVLLSLVTVLFFGIITFAVRGLRR